MILNCAIIDDEPLATELLASYVQKVPMLNLKGTYNSAITAMKDLREDPVDVLYLDIQMPELSGIELAKIIPSSTRIVFTTAFNQFAIDGYKVNALDYLLKPISFESFLASVEKAVSYFSAIRRRKTSAGNDFIYVKSDYKLMQVLLDDITYIEGEKDYVNIYTDKGGECITSLINMKKIEEYLPHPEFMRVHRSYIVHMPKIKMVDRGHFVFGDEHIPISDSYKREVARYLDSHTLS